MTSEIGELPRISDAIVLNSVSPTGVVNKAQLFFFCSLNHGMITALKVMANDSSWSVDLKRSLLWLLQIDTKKLLDDDGTEATMPENIRISERMEVLSR